MNIHQKGVSPILSFSIVLVLISAPIGLAEDYDALKGVEAVDTIFDFRDGIPEKALAHLKLIHDTFSDKAIRSVAEKPQFVVVFMDSSVKLLSKNRAAFSAEHKKILEEFDQVLSEMSKDGIRLEICMFAGSVHGVDPASLPKELIHVPNGWISSIGYQQKGFSLVPVY